jgi:integrase
MRSGPHTFETKAAAQQYLVTIETDMQRGQWIDPDAGSTSLDDYAKEWLASRPLRPTTGELYEGYLRNHIRPALGEVELAKLTPALVRRWHTSLNSRGIGPSTVAKCYRLLRAILATAVDDALILRNPCRVKGAGIEHATERPTATIRQIWKLADAVPERFRCVVLLAGFVGLRRGEVFGLERRHVDLLHGQLIVRQQQQELKGRGVVLLEPKTQAGVRRLALPDVMVTELKLHLERFTGPCPSDRVFVGEHGGPVRTVVWQKHWIRARDAAGLAASFHFHDLRHTANTLAASTTASTRELMHRFGHASAAAALRYQHATPERDAEIAAAVNELATQAEAEVPEEPADIVGLRSGTRVARQRRAHAQ